MNNVNDTNDETPGAQEFVNTVSDVSEIGSTTVTLAASSNASGILFAALHKLLSYIRFLNVEYSMNLEAALKTKKSDSILIRYLPTIPESLAQDLVAKPIHPIFLYRKVGPKLLGNFWKVSLFLCILITSSFILTIIIKFTQDNKSQNLVLKICKMIRMIIVKVLIMQFYLYFGDLVLYFILETRSLVMDTFASALSFFVALFFMIFGIAAFTFHFMTVKSLVKLSKSGENKTSKEKLDTFLKSHEEFDMLYKLWKDATLYQPTYLILFTLRDIILNIVISNLFEYPIVQSLLFVLITFSFWVYLISARPFKKLYENMKQIFLETIVLLTYLFAFLMSSSKSSMSNNLKESLGEGVIVMAIIFNIFAGLFIAWDVIIIINDAYKERKNKQISSKKIVPDSVNTSINQDLRSISHDTSYLNERKTEINPEGNSFNFEHDSQEFYANQNQSPQLRLKSKKHFQNANQMFDPSNFSAQKVPKFSYKNSFPPVNGSANNPLNNLPQLNPQNNIGIKKKKKRTMVSNSNYHATQNLKPTQKPYNINSNLVDEPKTIHFRKFIPNNPKQEAKPIFNSIELIEPQPNLLQNAPIGQNILTQDTRTIGHQKLEPSEGNKKLKMSEAMLAYYNFMKKAEGVKVDNFSKSQSPNKTPLNSFQGNPSTKTANMFEQQYAETQENKKFADYKDQIQSQEEDFNRKQEYFNQDPFNQNGNSLIKQKNNWPATVKYKGVEFS